MAAALSLQLRAAQKADLPRLAHIFSANFTPIMAPILPSGPTKADEALRHAQLARRLAERDADPRNAFLDVATRADDGEVLACTQWRIVDAGGYDAPEPHYAEPLPWPADAKPELHDAFFHSLEMNAKKYMDDRKHVRECAAPVVLHPS
jgi:hypothetical protein